MMTQSGKVCVTFNQLRYLVHYVTENLNLIFRSPLQFYNQQSFLNTQEHNSLRCRVPWTARFCTQTHFSQLSKWHTFPIWCGKTTGTRGFPQFLFYSLCYFLMSPVMLFSSGLIASAIFSVAAAAVKAKLNKNKRTHKHFYGLLCV